MAHHHPALSEDDVRTRLREADLRPTTQRMELGALLWSKGCRHVTAEKLHREAAEAGVKVSLATVYNTLHQFTSANLLREIVVERGCSYFDTNVDAHHHFLCEDSGELMDIPADHVDVRHVPKPPKGMKISSVDVIVRVSAR